jgi:hypothetical protein
MSNIASYLNLYNIFVSAEEGSIDFIANEEKVCGLAKEIKYIRKFPIDKADFQNASLKECYSVQVFQEHTQISNISIGKK